MWSTKGTKEYALLFLYVAYNLLQYAEMQILLCKNSLNTIANIREAQLQMKEIVLNNYKSLKESVKCRRKGKNISFVGGHWKEIKHYFLILHIRVLSSTLNR